MVRSSSLAAISANISAATTRNSKSGKAAVASPAPKARGTATAAAAKPSKANSKQLYKQYQQQWQKLKPQLDAVTDPAIVASARQVGKDVLKLSETNTDEQLQPELDELHLQIKDTLQYLAFASRTALTQPKADNSKQAKPFANKPEMLVADLRTNKKKGAAAAKGRPANAAAKQTASKKAGSKKADIKPEQASKKRKATQQSPVEEDEAASDVDPFDEGMLTDAESEKENDVEERQRSKKGAKSRKNAVQPASATKRSATKRAANDLDNDGPALQSPSRVSLKNQTEVRSKRRRLNA